MSELVRDTGWFKSSFSSADSDNCVEVRIIGDSVGVRDSKNADGACFWTGAMAWSRLVSDVSRSASLKR
jgi:hypothetical protein